MQFFWLHTVYKYSSVCNSVKQKWYSCVHTNSHIVNFDFRVHIFKHLVSQKVYVANFVCSTYPIKQYSNYGENDI